MNFGMVRAAFKVAKNFTVQHSPEILLGISGAAAIGATVSGCIATTKMGAINEKHKELLDELHKRGEHVVDDHGSLLKDTQEYKKSITKEYGRYWLQIGKTWAPCVGLTLLSGTCALGAFKIVNKRLLIAETAFAGISQAFEQYRDNVIEDQGLEKDAYYATNGALKKKEELIAKGKYNEKQIEAKVDEWDGTKGNTFDYILDYPYNEDTVNTSYYSSTPGHNFRWLDSALTLCQKQLEADGYLYLEDVYRRLGLDTSKIFEAKRKGINYIWTLKAYTEPGAEVNNHISFGIFEYNDTQHRLFRRGEVDDVTLHFNARLCTQETCELLAGINY